MTPVPLRPNQSDVKLMSTVGAVIIIALAAVMIYLFGDWIFAPKILSAPSPMQQAP